LKLFEFERTFSQSRQFHSNFMVLPYRERHIRSLPFSDLVNRYTIKKTVDSGVDNGDLNFDRDRLAEKIRFPKSVSSQTRKRKSRTYY